MAQTEGRRHATLARDLNLNVRGLKLSATLAINERAKAMLEEGRQVYKLGLGQSPFPVPDVVVKQLQEHAHEKDYLPVRGLRALRHSVANYHRLRHGIECAAQDVLIGPGSKELMFILQLVYYGDLVIPTPSWVSYAPQANIIGRPITWVPTRWENDLKLLASDLDRVCQLDPSRPRLVVLNYPSNPSGTTYTMPELKALARVARKYNVVLVSDEIYGELHHRGQHVSIARFYPEGTIISSGLSKWCGAGGWRLGTFTFPRGLSWLLDAMAVVASETYTSTSTPIQHAAVRAFRGGIEIEEYLFHARRILRRLGRYAWVRLTKVGAVCPEPKGAFYVFPNLSNFKDGLAARGIRTGPQLCEALLEDTGVAVLPGSAFGRPIDELSFRLAYVDFDGARALVAARGIGGRAELTDAFLRNYCHNVVQGVDRIVVWLRKTQQETAQQKTSTPPS
jgi:aspartate aminotransferase